MPNDSTTNQLVSIYNTLCKALDDGLEIRIVFFDISKAFDTVPHKRLLSKLENYGIRNNTRVVENQSQKLLDWFQN